MSDALPCPSRRRLLRAAAALAAAGILAPPVRRASAAARFTAQPFSLGVASGCPRPDGIVLWTRLAPDPAEGGGMPPENVTVDWEIARDERFREIVRKGSVAATPELAHSVHVELRGLDSDRIYWYRFRAGDAGSPVGCTRTAPAPGAAVSRLRFAFASCQHYEQGWYAAYRHMAAEDVALVVFLGDYIYESSRRDAYPRRHGSPEPYTLAQYRDRYALYRTDTDLQRMHALVPWLMTWDDHEVDNDYANDRSQDLAPDFLQRRAAAYRAYYEHLPLERAMLPRGPDMRLYERFEFGALARFHVLDDRQYRAPQACPRPGRGGSTTVDAAACPERLDPQRSLLGMEQERWLETGLATGGTRWNVIAQQTVMAQIDQTPGPGASHWTDGWDGYPAARRRLLDFMARTRPANPLVIGGDVHSHWVSDLRPDFDDPASPVVATEFCGTSITSLSWPQARLDAMRPDNPHVRFANSERRGYVVMELDAKRCAVRLRGLDDVTSRTSGIVTQASFVVEDGRPGAKPA